MGFDGNGNFLRVHNWQSDAEAGIKIRADRHDAEDDNIAEGLSNTLTRDGQSPPTANIPMNGFKIVTLGPPASGTDAATKAYVDSVKKFTNDIEVTDEVIFKDGTTTRGFIKGAIGSGVAAELLFEADNDGGVLVNRMTLDSNGLNLRVNGYRLTPGGVMRASFYAETSATVGAYLRGYDNTGTEKVLMNLGSNYITLRPSDPAVTSGTFRFATSDNVLRAVITSDGAQPDGKMSFDIRNTAGTVRNSMGLDINGLTLATGKIVAPAWEFLDNKATIDGNVLVGTTTNYVQFTGTSVDVASALIRIRDNRVTVGAEGNAVFAIKRQNSSTDCLLIGNDANHAPLIGGNNMYSRFGKWVSGVFTEAMKLDTSTGMSIDATTGAGGLNILPTDTSSGRLFFTATTHTWSMYANEAGGELIFSSGGTFASATGSARHRFYENGDYLATGKIEGQEAELGPTSGTGARGINLLSTVDTMSGRLFFNNGVAAQSIVMVQQADNTLSFNVAATYGSSSGSRVYKFGTDGRMETANYLRSRFGVEITQSGIDAAIRGKLVLSGSNDLYLQKIDTDGSTIQGQIILGTNMVAVTPSSTNASGVIRLANYAAARRIDISWSATNPFAIVARDATDDSIFASIVANASGVPFWTYGTGTSSEMITVATLNLATYTGSTAANLVFPVSTTLLVYANGPVVNAQALSLYLAASNQGFQTMVNGTALTGTWRARGVLQYSSGNYIILAQRTA